MRDVAQHRGERAIAVAHVLEEPERSLRVRGQELAIRHRQRCERFLQQLGREVDAQQACARITPAARCQNVSCVERDEDFVFELERDMAIEAQRVAAIPRSMNGRYAACLLYTSPS